MRHIVAGPLRGFRFALRAQVVRRCAAPGSRCCARSPCSPLRGSRVPHRASLLRRPPCPLRGRSVVSRCCGSLSPLRGARSVVRRCCDALPRFAGRRPVSPLLRLAVGLRARYPHSLPIFKYVPGIHVSTRVSLSVPGIHVSTRPSASASASVGVPTHLA